MHSESGAPCATGSIFPKMRLRSHARTGRSVSIASEIAFRSSIDGVKHLSHALASPETDALLQLKRAEVAGVFPRVVFGVVPFGDGVA